MTPPDVPAIRSRLAELAGQSGDPSEKIRELRKLERELKNGEGTRDLLGVCQRYIADHELRREAEYMASHKTAARARENADVADAMVEQGIATREELAAIGLLSHTELSERREDGTLTEAVLERAAEAL